MPKRPQPAPKRAVPSATSSRSRGLLAGFVILLLITGAAYQPAWHGGVLWDDDAHLTSPSLRGASGLARIWFDIGATQQYYPVVHTAFWMMNAVWGDNMLGYHLVTIALHALLALLLALALRRLEIPGAWIAAVIFALHPVHVESVAWITELKNTLSGVFYMLAALAYLRFDRARHRKAYGAALLLFALALLSKSVTATLPVGLLVVFWWQRGRIDWRRDAQPLIPFVALGLVAGLTTAWVERTFIGASGSDFGLTIVDRGLLAGRAVWFYLAALFWPANLVFIYPRWEISAAVWWQYLCPAAAIVLTVVLWQLRARSRAPMAAWAFFVVTLAPALGFVNVYPFRYSFVADHFQYLASIGVIALVAASIATLMQRRSLWTFGREAIACTAIAVPLFALTWRQTHQYANAIVLYETTIQRNPACWLAHNNLAALALSQSPPALDVALGHARESLALNPANDVAHNNLGLVRQRQGDFETAAAEHREAIRLNPGYADAHTNLGVDLAALGHRDEAIREYEEAIRLAPHTAGPRLNLGIVLQNVGRVDDAIAALKEALRLEPVNAEAHNSLGTALQRAGRVDEAIAEYREAARLQPSNGAVQNNLGSALFSLRRYDDALLALREAARLSPESADAHNNLGILLGMRGQQEEAASHFAEAVRLRPDFVQARENLAKVRGKS